MCQVPPPAVKGDHAYAIRGGNETTRKPQRTPWLAKARVIDGEVASGWLSTRRFKGARAAVCFAESDASPS